LKQGKFEELERHLYEVSDPDHYRYGEHLSQKDVEELVRPTADTSDSIDEWLADNGIAPEDCSYSPARDWITVSLPVKEVERLLDTVYSTYQHEDGTLLVRTTSWSVPRHLHDHISTIQPTTAFLRSKTLDSTFMEVPHKSDWYKPYVPPENVTGIAAACNFSAVTPTCLRTLYDTINYTPQSTAENTVGFTNYLGEITNRSDTSIFLEMFRPEAVAAAYEYAQISIAGGPVWNGTNVADSGSGREANLDTETILGIAWPTNVTAWSTGGSPPFKPDEFTPTDTNEPYLTWANYITAQSQIPQVISTSYGDDEQSVPFEYAKTVCNLFAQLGARGITLLFSSGDEGVGSNGSCITNDGKNTSTFLPAFPASCPYVTTVGGTKEYPEVVAFDPRNGYASGGGFSNYFLMPSYQEEVVPAYIASLDGKYDGLYNKSGRGYPDIAAQGYHFLTIWNGTILPLDGTSCASPTVAGVLTLVNDALIAAGKSTLGFLNPWLYKKGYKAFTDVTVGSALGCNETSDGLGFPATQGWDAVSGFGTPYFPAILELKECGKPKQ
jgi:tripeptidyl-peptidase-1